MGKLNILLQEIIVSKKSPKHIWIKISRKGVRIKRSCFKQCKATFFLRNVVNQFIAYKLSRRWQCWKSDFILKDCLFRAVKLTLDCISFFIYYCHKNLSIQNKGLWYKTIFIAFRKHFQRFYSQTDMRKPGLIGYVYDF